MNMAERLKSAERVAVFGAQAIAYGFVCALKEVFGKRPECYIVSKGENPENIDGVKVLPIEEALFCRKHLIVVAVPVYLHDEISEMLKRHGFEDIFLLDSHAEYDAMSSLFRKRGRFQLLEDMPLSSKTPLDVKVFMAKSCADKPLSGTYSFEDYITPVHAGAILEERRICEIADDSGENISRKNRDYCELTATYWAWKNVSAQYKGICHYRRILDLGKDGFQRFSNMDVLLPLPFVCFPDASTQHGRYVNSTDFSAMMDALRDIQPLYYAAAEKIFKERYLYGYNMLIAKEEVFNNYCEFLFGVLGRVEAHFDGIGKKREDRYLGYIGELLTSLYFMHNADKYNIAHGKKWWFG